VEIGAVEMSAVEMSAVEIGEGAGRRIRSPYESHRIRST